jgi:hypothetical protein
MTEEQIDALLDETVTKPKDEWTEVHRLAWVAAYRRADQETKDLVLGILRGTIDVAVSVSVPR